MAYERKKLPINLKFDSSIEEVTEIVHIFSQKSEQYQRALCCLIGSYAGDNLGNYNEFWKEINEQQLNEAMQMEGKGTHGLLPGQSTDDTELATSLGFGLAESLTKGVMNLDLIAKYYICWSQSQPFDMGNTIRQAVQRFNGTHIKYSTNYLDFIYDNYALQMKTSSYNNNQSSQSNGGLMRIAPLIVYLSQINNQEIIKKAVYEEQSLTHPNEIGLECSYIFTRACIQLIQTGNAQETFKTIDQYVKNECNKQEIIDIWNQHVLQEKHTNAIQSMGYIMHAFSMSFIFLKLISDYNLSGQSQFKPKIYKHFIRKAIGQCGDSDTNAAICGTMLGSLLQLQDFPIDYLQKILYCDLQNTNQPLLKHQRHSIYNPRNCIYLCDQLLKLGPSYEHDLLIYPQNIDELIQKQNKQVVQINQFQEKQIIQKQLDKLNQINPQIIQVNELQHKNKNGKNNLAVEYSFNTIKNQEEQKIIANQHIPSFQSNQNNQQNVNKYLDKQSMQVEQQQQQQVDTFQMDLYYKTQQNKSNSQNIEGFTNNLNKKKQDQNEIDSSQQKQLQSKIGIKNQNPQNYQNENAQKIEENYLNKPQNQQHIHNLIQNQQYIFQNEQKQIMQYQNNQSQKQAGTMNSQLNEQKYQLKEQENPGQQIIKPSYGQQPYYQANQDSYQNQNQINIKNRYEFRYNKFDEVKWQQQQQQASHIRSYKSPIQYNFKSSVNY